MDGPFRSYSAYLMETYGRKAYRVAVDAGFSCPHRGRDRNRRGCIYCDARGSRAGYLGDEEDLRKQVQTGIRFLKKRYGAEVFLLYFQAFSNTYAQIPELKRVYDYALGMGPFRELIVSTRPDCVSEEVADLLSDYRTDERDVWVELGLQSASDRTLNEIRRGHTLQDFYDSYERLRDRGIKVAVHLIFGLPGENWAEIRRTVVRVAAFDPDGIKIHNLHIPYGTELYDRFLNGETSVPCSRRHLDYVVNALELLPPRTIVMRLTCDTPAEYLVVPRNFWDKAAFYSALRERMERNGNRQGRLWDGVTGSKSL